MRLALYYIAYPAARLGAAVLLIPGGCHSDAFSVKDAAIKSLPAAIVFDVLDHFGISTGDFAVTPQFQLMVVRRANPSQ